MNRIVLTILILLIPYALLSQTMSDKTRKPTHNGQIPPALSSHSNNPPDVLPIPPIVTYGTPKRTIFDVAFGDATEVPKHQVINANEFHKKRNIQDIGIPSFHISELSKDAQNIVVECLFTAAFREIPVADANGYGGSEGYLTELRNRRQYREGYVRGLSTILDNNFNVVLRNAEMLYKKDPTIALQPSPYRPSDIIQGDRFFLQGVEDGTFAMFRRLDEIGRETLRVAAKYPDKDKEVSVNEKIKRIKEVPQLEALLYLHDNISKLAPFSFDDKK